MKWYFQNILYGIKIAFLLPSKKKSYVATWDAVIAGLITSIGIQFFIELLIIGKNSEISYYWYNYHFSLFVMLVIASHIISSIFVNRNKMLDVAVIFYYSYIIVLIPYFIFYSYEPEWLTENAEKSIDNLIMVWSYLVMFRIIGICFHSNIEKQVCMSLIAPVLVYTLNYNIYLSHFFYPYDDDVTYESAVDRLTDEEFFLSQKQKLPILLNSLPKSQKGTVDLYGIVLGSYSYEDVFMKEVNYVSQRIENKLAMKDHVIKLINNEKTFSEIPVASISNLTETLNHIGKLSQNDEDILFLYMTSHGSAERGLSVEMSYNHSLMNLSGERLATALKGSQIKNKIIIISSCFSGSLIDPLKDDNTMIITASAKNVQSYGCSEDADLTYFADSYFRHAFEKTTDLEKAFYFAKEYVEEREKKEGLSPPSNPQIFIGKNVRKILEKYKPVIISHADHDKTQGLNDKKN